ncbi:MAG: sulfite exporter TauE/SafE family protein [Planctomycetota bacterium]
MDLSVLQWTGAGVAALLVGLSKAGFGAGAGLLAVPLMTAVLGPQAMLPVMLLVLITGDVFSIWHYRTDHDKRNLAMLIPGLVLGVAAGWLALDWFRELPHAELWMKRVIGFLAVSFVGLQFYRMQREHRLGLPGEPYRPRAAHGVGLGAAAGLTSTLAHAGGPLIMLFMVPQKLEKQVFVGTVIKYFFVGNSLKVIPYLREGLLDLDSGLVALSLLPAVGVGAAAGVFLHGKFSDRLFRLVIYVLALCVGIYLLSGWKPRAVTPLQGAQRTDEPDPLSSFRTGLSLYGEGDFRGAAAAFRRAGEVGGELRCRAALNRGLALYRAGRHAEAEAAFALAAGSATAPIRLRAFLNSGNAAFRRGSLSRAERFYAQAERAAGSALHRGENVPAASSVLPRAAYNLAVTRAATETRATEQQPEEAGPRGGRGEESVRPPTPEEGEPPMEWVGGKEQPMESETGTPEGGMAGMDETKQLVSAALEEDTGPVLRGRRPGPTPGGKAW